jgi:hypothetical protein
MTKISGSYLKNRGKKGERVMEKREIRTLAGWMVFLVFTVSLVAGIGCSREQAPPPPPQAAAPAPAAQAPAPAPAAPGPAAPAGTTPGAAPAAQPGATAPNISQIQTGMTVDQVKQIMGNPTEMKVKGAITEYKYYTPQKVEIKFQNNQVIGVEMH